ncbi:hypothetical protein ATANTOWER_009632 [Ataeniobius toweri]|uniref:Uncharacterized protein n=1 Tax=Ataeniobius toweri TaxID=208326 RepID=A0ABU7BYE3_9TELE|nr:hypothetical protein [Ataeniobius toweri]
MLNHWLPVQSRSNLFRSTLTRLQPAAPHQMVLHTHWAADWLLHPRVGKKACHGGNIQNIAARREDQNHNACSGCQDAGWESVLAAAGRDRRSGFRFVKSFPENLAG